MLGYTTISQVWKIFAEWCLKNHPKINHCTTVNIANYSNHLNWQALQQEHNSEAAKKLLVTMEGLQRCSAKTAGPNTGQCWKKQSKDTGGSKRLDFKQSRVFLC